jgi:hypothetical protein
MLKKLLKFMKCCVVSGISWIAPRNTNRHIEYGIVNPVEEILTYRSLIVPEQDTVMVFSSEIPRYNWATSSKQEQELTEVFSRIGQEGLW